MTLKRPFLIVEDDRRIAKGLSRALGRFCDPRVADTVDAARQMLKTDTDWAGFLMDVELPDGNGLDVLQRARKKYPVVPALVITAHLEPELVNRAFKLEAGYVCKPFGPQEILPFVFRCLGGEAANDRKVISVVDDLAQKHGLTPTEREIILESIRGTPRGALASLRDVSESTVKTQIRSLLCKLGADDLSDVTLRILRGALAEAVVVRAARAAQKAET